MSCAESNYMNELLNSENEVKRSNGSQSNLDGYVHKCISSSYCNYALTPPAKDGDALSLNCEDISEIITLVVFKVKVKLDWIRGHISFEIEFCIRQRVKNVWEFYCGRALMQVKYYNTIKVTFEGSYTKLISWHFQGVHNQCNMWFLNYVCNWNLQVWFRNFLINLWCIIVIFHYNFCYFTTQEISQ